MSSIIDGRKFAVSFLTAFFMVALIHITVFSAETDVKVVVDGTEITFEQEPIIVDGRVMTPVEPIAEALGWDVNINEYAVYLKTHGSLEVIPNKMFYTYYNSDIGLTEGELFVRHFDTVGTFDTSHFLHEHYPQKTREVCHGETTCSVLEEINAHQLIVRPMIHENTLYIAVHDLAEALYANTAWDEVSRTVIITRKPLPYYDCQGLPDEYGEWLLENTFQSFKPHGAVVPWETPEQTDEEFLEIMETEVIRLVNELRVAEGLNSVQRDPAINEAAKIRADEIMVDFSHNRPNGEPASTAYDTLPYVYGSENILSATMGKKGESAAKFAVDIWMESSGHRANILNPDFVYMGFAAIRSEKSVVYCVHGFMK